MCRLLLHSSGVTYTTKAATYIGFRGTGAIVECERLSISKGIPAGHAEIKRRACSRFGS